MSPEIGLLAEIGDGSEPYRLLDLDRALVVLGGAGPRPCDGNVGHLSPVLTASKVDATKGVDLSRGGCAAMGYSGLDVDPDRLRVVAGEVAGAGVALRRAGTSRGPALAPAQGEAEGWVAAEAARTAATCWSGFLNRLASSVDALSGRLRTAAQSYVASDSRAEASLRKQYVE